MGLVRIIVWFTNSVYLVRFSKRLLKSYFLVDSNFVLLLASAGVFIYLGVQEFEDLGPSIYLGVYPFILFFLTGNFRVMMTYCNWKRWQVAIYKFVRVNAVLFYLVFGVFSMEQDKTPIINRDMYLLFIFTTLGYFLEMLATMNRFDQSDVVIFNLGLKNQ